MPGLLVADPWGSDLYVAAGLLNSVRRNRRGSESSSESNPSSISADSTSSVVLGPVPSAREVAHPKQLCLSSTLPAPSPCPSSARLSARLCTSRTSAVCLYRPRRTSHSPARIPLSGRRHRRVVLAPEARLHHLQLPKALTMPKVPQMSLFDERSRVEIPWCAVPALVPDVRVLLHMNRAPRRLPLSTIPSMLGRNAAKDGGGVGANVRLAQ